MQHADGEILGARAAEKFGVPFTLSTMSICSIEDVAANTTKPFWFQLYVMRDRDFVERLIDRAKAAKCSALMLTLDLQVLGPAPQGPHQRPLGAAQAHARQPRRTSRPSRAGASACSARARRTFGNIVGHAKGVGDLSSLSAWTSEQFDPRLSWADVEWVKKRWGGKLILKGILDVGGCAPRRGLRRRCAHRLEPRRPPARWRALVDPRAAARSPMRWARASRCGWTAASARARTCCKAVALGAQGHADRAAVPLRPGRDGRGGRHALPRDHPQRARPHAWRSAGAPTSATVDRGILLPGSVPQ